MRARHIGYSILGIMPWKTVDLMDQKLKFVHLAMSGRFTITELCEDFGISRKTGHKYLRRYQQQGACGWKEKIATIERKKRGERHRGTSAFAEGLRRDRKGTSAFAEGLRRDREGGRGAVGAN